MARRLVPVSDMVDIIVNTPATANAGADQTVCGNAPVSIGATANGAGMWTGGTGTFANASMASTTYTPTMAEIGTTVTLFTLDDHRPRWRIALYQCI
ncbi:MAG: hypothetical protein R2795_13855 [Saprospiraceae bacterium]